MINFTTAEYPAVPGDEFEFNFTLNASVEDVPSTVLNAAFRIALARLNEMVAATDGDMAFEGEPEFLTLVCRNKRRNRTGKNDALGRSFQEVLINIARMDDPDFAPHGTLLERDLNRVGKVISECINAALPAAIESVEIPMSIVNRLNTDDDETRDMARSMLTQAVSNVIPHVLPEADGPLLAQIQTIAVEFVEERLGDLLDSLPEIVREAMTRA